MIAQFKSKLTTAIQNRLDNYKEDEIDEVESGEIKAYKEVLDMIQTIRLINDKPLNDFEVMSIMSKDNMDIAMFPDLTDANKVKNGYKITFGVPPQQGEQIIQQMATGKQTHYVVVYKINKEQFERIKKEKS